MEEKQLFLKAGNKISKMMKEEEENHRKGRHNNEEEEMEQKRHITGLISIS